MARHLSGSRLWIDTLAWLVLLCVSAIVWPTLPVAAADSKAKDAPKPLSSDKIKNGVVAEVWRVFRGSDGMLEIQWGYRNPTEKEVLLFNVGEAADFMRDVYVIDPGGKTKYHVAEFDNKPEAPKAGKKKGKDWQASEARYTTLGPGESVMFWAKFTAPPESTKEVSLYLPNAPPQEDLTISPTPAPVAEPKGDEPLASARGPSGVTIEVTRVRFSSDGLVDVRWQAVNHQDHNATLFNVDDAKAFPSKICLEDPGTKTWHLVATDDKGVPLMSPAKYTVLDAGGSESFWAKFKIPAGTKTVSLFLPHTLPIEDLPITEKK